MSHTQNKSLNTMTRTREQALRHILNEYEAGRLGATSCSFGSQNFINSHGVVVSPEAKIEIPVYSSDKDENTHCSIGCLFTEDQLKDIKRRHLNDASVSKLETHIGTENIQYVTGLSIDELYYIQRMHDNQPNAIKNKNSNTKLHEYLNTELAKIVRSRMRDAGVVV